MKSYSDLWEYYISEDNIRESVRKSSLGKRNRLTVAKVFYDLDNQIDDIRYYATHFKNANHVPMEIYDGIQHKKRTIIVPTYKEQIVHHMVVRTLTPMFKRGMYEHSYGSIPGRGAHNGKKEVEKWIRKGGANIKYCLKMDIYHFFPTIPHPIIIDMLERKIKDKQLLEVVVEIINATEVGLPLGFYTSQWLANWYLQGLDHYIKEELKAVYYIRYMDDMVIFGSNKNDLHKMRKAIDKYLQNILGLRLKGNWQVFRFHNIVDGKEKYRALDFMGFQFYRNRTILRRSIAVKAERKARTIHAKKKYTSYDSRQMLSYAGWIDSTNTYDFYKERIKPFVSFRDLRRKVSEADRRKNKEKNNESHL